MTHTKTGRALKEELRSRMHQSIPEQGQWLFRVITGYFAYHAVPTNITSLGSFRSVVVSLWRRTSRVSQALGQHLQLVGSGSPAGVEAHGFVGSPIGP